MNMCKRVGSLMLSLLLVFSLLSSTLAVQTYAATVPVLSAESKSVSPGEQFTIKVNLANATSVYGGNFTLQYDSNLLTADSFAFGSIVGGHTKNCNLDYQSAGNLIRFTFSGASALISSGTLVTFTFTAKQSVSGSAALKFTAYKMYDENGSAITSTASSATITISSKPVVSPSISIANKTVTVGETVSVPVMLSNSSDVYGGNFTLQYDNSLLTAESYSFGSIVSGHTKNCNLDYQSAGNLIRVTFSGAEAISSDGTLITLTFTAKAAGTASLQFTAYKMYDENGSSIATTMDNSEIVIENKPTNITAEGTWGDNLTWVLYNDGLLTISGSGDMMWSGYPHYNGYPWNSYKSEITTIQINEGVTSIELYAFYNYSKVANVILPTTLTEINDYAFANCYNLENINLPDSLISIGDSAFSACWNLAEIKELSDLEHLGNKVFEGSAFFENQQDTVKYYGKWCIGCENLVTTATIKSGTKYIAGRAFEDCPELIEIIMPNSLICIDEYAFYGCVKLSKVIFSNQLKTIGSGAFYDCALIRVGLPDSLISIESEAFMHCYNLTEIIIPKSVISIGDCAFAFAHDLVIYGQSSSYAETYATENAIDFVALDAKTLTSVSIYTEPSAISYYIGDTLDTNGLTLKLAYSDGSTETVSSGFTTSGFSSTSVGTKTITVEYGGKTTTFSVTVNTPSVFLSSTSTSMTVGDTATLTATTTPSGQTVAWTSSNTGVATVSDGTITAKAAGTATITAKFTYNGITYRKNCSVTVASAPNPEPTLSSISIATKPTKTTYEIGESLNTSGLTLKLTYSDGSTKTVSSGFTTSGFSSATAGTKTVKVTYSGKSTNFTVIVNEPIIDQNKPCVTIERKNARVGSTVSITVNLQNNPGIWGMDLAVNYDKSQLTLTNVTNGTVFSSSEWMQGSLTGDKYILSYEASGFEDNTTNGVLATLEFTVNENATVDSFSDISLSYNTGDIINVNFDDIEMSVVSGGINITNFIYGDLNGDGLVNKKDSLLMKMYLADNSTIIDKQAADVYADGIINKKDSLYLKQYLAGLDVELGA